MLRESITALTTLSSTTPNPFHYAIYITFLAVVQYFHPSTRCQYVLSL